MNKGYPSSSSSLSTGESCNLWHVINTGTRGEGIVHQRGSYETFFPRTLEIHFLGVFPRRVERKQKIRFEITALATVRIMKISFDYPYDTLHDKHSIY